MLSVHLRSYSTLVVLHMVYLPSGVTPNAKKRQLPWKQNFSPLVGKRACNTLLFVLHVFPTAYSQRIAAECYFSIISD